MFAVHSFARHVGGTGRRLLRDAPLHGQAIRGIRIGNTEIPDNKGLLYSLQYIKGIGPSTARQILNELCIGNKNPRELTGLQIDSLRNEVLEHTIGHYLDREKASDIKRLVDIQCYRGIRHQDGLPCRGQRTRCNARTRKGKPIAIAGKKAPR